MSRLEPPAEPAALPPAARALAQVVTDAVAAASSADPAAWARARDRLATADPDQLRRLLSALLRSLLEDLHPDGVGADDLRDVVAGCTARAAAWAPEVDPQLLVVVVAGAFGIHPHEEERPDGTSPQVAAHACLLVADLLPGSGRRLAPCLRAAFAELARAEREDDA